MLRSLSITPSKCTGCLQCEMACSLVHDGSFSPAKSRIKVISFYAEGRFVPYTCTQCADAWCMNACPTDAIRNDSNLGAKLVDDALCVGCKTCTIACPFGTINYNVDTGKVIKCDLCDGKPACVMACPTEAITYVDAGSTGYDKMREWAARSDNQAAASA